MAKVMDNYRDLVQRAEQLLKERGEAGKVRVQVGSATCEHAAGSREVLAEFKKYVAASGRGDIVLRQTGCTGRCSREPIVTVLLPGQIPVRYERVDREAVHQIFTQHVLAGRPVTGRILDAQRGRDMDDARGRDGSTELAEVARATHGRDAQATLDAPLEVLFCGGIRCGRAAREDFHKLFQQKLQQAGVPPSRVRVIEANCFALCRYEHRGKATHLLVRPLNIIYRVNQEKDLDDIIAGHFLGGQVIGRLLAEDEQPIGKRFFQMYGDVAFFNRQSRIALRNSGIVNPEDIHEYIHYRGFEGIADVLDRADRQWVIEQLSLSKLRGRGGAGYPTGLKWSLAGKQDEAIKYVICNADEGDPGAYMDRSVLEGDPFSVIEGMMIGGFAMGASEGFIYCRSEYPLAVKRCELAIAQCRKHGLLGRHILGSDFDFELEVRLGGGAFVCGEETALINSIEGKRGQPDIRPPYPTEVGLWGKPTCINNVETWANVPPIIVYGAEWFARIGTEHSGGTKVFSLTGKVAQTGLIEVPLGTTLREVIFDIGGGVPGGKKLKAVQTGGPAGGVLPAEMLDTPIDFDTLTRAGSIMGSGGMIVMDEDDCMVDIARYYLAFNMDESCGKCTPCREGTKRLVEILERITAGMGTMEDLAKLERLGKLLKKASFCGLGRSAPNPLLSTLRHFQDEYLAHVKERRCPAGRCKALSPRDTAPPHGPAGRGEEVKRRAEGPVAAGS